MQKRHMSLNIILSFSFDKLFSNGKVKNKSIAVCNTFNSLFFIQTILNQLTIVLTEKAAVLSKGDVKKSRNLDTMQDEFGSAIYNITQCVCSMIEICLAFEENNSVFTRSEKEARMYGVRDVSTCPGGTAAVCDSRGVCGGRGSLLPGQRRLIWAGLSAELGGCQSAAAPAEEFGPFCINTLPR